jgi:DNA-binding MarR family transcriptional regulator
VKTRVLHELTEKEIAKAEEIDDMLQQDDLELLVVISEEELQALQEEAGNDGNSHCTNGSDMDE